MGRHRIDAAALEERARVHAARIEQLDDDLTATRRRLTVADAEHQVQAAIIRRRNAAVLGLVHLVVQLLAARPEPRVLDTGTPGVEVTQ